MASAEDIPPGGEGHIKVTFKTAKKSGQRTQRISVFTNDPENKIIRLKVTADIQVALALDPSSLNFRTLRKSSQSSEKKVKLTGKDKDITQIESVVSKNKYVRAEVEPLEIEGKTTQQQISVSILPGMKPGNFREKITVHTDHNVKKELFLLVFGKVLGDITVSPAILSFGSFRKGGKYDRRLRLTAAPGFRFNVLEVKSTHPDLIPKVETIKEGAAYRIHVSLLESFEQDLLYGEIIIVTDNESQEKIKIKVSGRGFE